MSILAPVFVALVESDHDLLIQMSEKVDLIYKLLSNHLEHHFVYNITLLGALLSLVSGVVLYLWRSRKGPRPVLVDTKEVEGEKS